MHYNMLFQDRNLKKKFWGEAQPPQDPSPLGRDKPLPRPTPPPLRLWRLDRRAFGAPHREGRGGGLLLRWMGREKGRKGRGRESHPPKVEESRINTGLKHVNDWLSDRCARIASDQRRSRQLTRTAAAVSTAGRTSSRTSLPHCSTRKPSASTTHTAPNPTSPSRFHVHRYFHHRRYFRGYDGHVYPPLSKVWVP